MAWTTRFTPQRSSRDRSKVCYIHPVAREELTLDRRVVLELDGPGVFPETVDAALVLELAAAFFALVQGNAVEDAAPIALRGIEILDKCVAIAVPVDAIELVLPYTEAARLQLIGEQEPPRGLTTIAERGRSALRRLPEDHTAKIITGTWTRALSLPKPRDVQPLDSILSIRAVPLRIGGINPLARFRSEFEPEPFTLSVTESLARKLGPYLYKEVDIEAKVGRSADGTIERGRLEEFEPVEGGDPRPAWRAWFESVGGNEWEPHRH